MEKATPEIIDKKIKASGLSRIQVYRFLKIPRGWFERMMSSNSRYYFNNPDPDRMKRINKFLDEFKKFLKRWDDKI